MRCRLDKPSLCSGKEILFRKSKPINFIRSFYLNYKRMVMMVSSIRNLELKLCRNKIVDMLMDVRYFIDNRSRKILIFSSHEINVIFYSQRFRLIKHYLVEFNQLAMSAANGAACHDMMNRVMTKDNIGLMAFLETKEEIYSHTFSNG